MAYPWTDRAGRFSALKALSLAVIFAPAIWIIGGYYAGYAGPRALNWLIHQTGDWAVYFILASLTVTPARRILDMPKLILIRRQLGLAGFFYTAAHFTLYVADQEWVIGKVAFAIALHFYITVGFFALLGLIALAVTSTDGSIRRLGKRWTLLHKLAYPIAILALYHFFLQSKLNVGQPTILAGCFLLLMTYRWLQSKGPGLNPWTLLGAAIAIGLLTAGLEAAWFGLATGVKSSQVFAANLYPLRSIRPAWWVLIIGLGVAALGWLRPRDPSVQRGRRALVAAPR